MYHYLMFFFVCFILSLIYCTLLIALACFFFFFFSSRRRHTRCSRDWSSDVCSSDLGTRPEAGLLRAGARDAPGSTYGPGQPARSRAGRRRRRPAEHVGVVPVLRGRDRKSVV